MTKPDSMDAPGEQSRENAIDARTVEQGQDYVRFPIRERTEPFEYPASHDTSRGDTQGERRNGSGPLTATANVASDYDTKTAVGNVPAMPPVEPAPSSRLPSWFPDGWADLIRCDCDACRILRDIQAIVQSHHTAINERARNASNDQP